MAFSFIKILRFALIVCTVTAVWIAAFFLADYVADNNLAQELVRQFGYLGVIVIAIISGINVIVPVPAASFVSVFIVSGLTMPLIIASLVIGTVIADFLGYFFGRWSRDFTIEHYPKIYTRLLAIKTNHRQYLLPAIFVYAAIFPFPNEAIIIPAAMIGISFRSLILPLVLGNIIHQSILAYGTDNIFGLFF